MNNIDKFKWVMKHCELRGATIWSKGSIGRDGRNLPAKPYTIKANSVNGYCQIQVKGINLLAHQVFFMLYNNRPIKPGMMIDHKNGDKTDNTSSNLRELTRRQNGQNHLRHRKGRLPGACFDTKSKKWKSCISINGKNVHLGLFDTELEAHLAYCKAHEEYGFGKVLNVG